jgi:DNA-directed RNA polymerase specialized sigma24 family protein
MNEPGPPPKGDEVELFLAGDAATIASVRKIIESVVSHRKYGIPRNERPDIVQQALADLCRAARKPGFRLLKTLACLVSYLAHCRCVDWWRERQETEALPEGLADTARRPDEMILLTDDRELTTRIMKRLPPGCYWLMVMVLGLEIPYAEVSTMTGRSEGALRVQMWSCVRKARKVHQMLNGGRPGRAPGTGRTPETGKR